MNKQEHNSDVRQKLPGLEREEILCSFTDKDGKKKSLLLVYRITGFMGDVGFVHSFWVKWDGLFGDDCKVFPLLQDAVSFYEKI